LRKLVLERKRLSCQYNRKRNPYLRFSILAIWSILLVAVFGFQLSGVVHANGGTVLYVQPSGLDSGGCDSWGNACTLQYALGLAVSGDEVWVSAGTYHPTSGTDRTISFVLISGVGVYGGFNGTESARQDRDPSANVTILSGDIGTIGNSADNSYHVVTGSGTDALPYWMDSPSPKGMQISTVAPAPMAAVFSMLVAARHCPT
jgi:hypothetical protein